MGRQKLTSAQLDQKKQQQQQQLGLEQSRPRRKATNAHIFRYLQTRNPSRLEENDLRRALEASLEECPDFWPAEDTASCSSSDQSNAPSASSNSSTSEASCNINCCKYLKRSTGSIKRRSSSKSSSMQHNHFGLPSNNHCHHNNHNHHHYHPTSNLYSTANNQCCPITSARNRRYKPVAKKNIYNEADFFHEGIMEYIEYELMRKHIISSIEEL